MQQQSLEKHEEECLNAQRAAVEAVLVGRETLAQAQSQGEQLERAESIADETQYKLDKAGRMLRGMTWSGWVANMFTKDIGPTSDSSSSVGGNKSKQPPLVYENIPESCRATAQAIQNYHANIQVLEECETEEQKETCIVICDSMYEAAALQVNLLKSNASDVEAYQLQFESHLDILRTRQRHSQQQRRGLEVPKPKSPNKSESTQKDKQTLIASISAKKASPERASPSSKEQQEQEVVTKQDAHLEFLSQNLDELGSISVSLHEALGHQNQTIDSLDEKSESILHQTKRVTRRADRLIQNKSWSPVKPTYECHVSIRHIESGRYLAVVNKDLYLVPKFHPEICVFEVWKRQGAIFGLKSKFSSKWVGQNLFGSLVCSASYFGRREEWEADSEDDWTSTRLLCASAAWGAGCYLIVRSRDHAVLIGGSGVEEKQKADLWCMTQQE